MSFATLQYLIFLVGIVSLYWWIPHRFRWILLLVSSYFFYGSWKIEYIGLLACSTLIAYIFGAKIAQGNNKKTYLSAGLIFLVLILAYFKYTSLILQVISDLSGLISGNPLGWTMVVLLPVGISFFIFQCISYLIDVYRDPTHQETHLGYFAVYIAFFPQLVAGPIERSGDILPQLRKKKIFQSDDWYSGWYQILWGLFKKIVVADQAGLFVDQVYTNSSTSGGLMLLLATYAFAIQIYADFSGYCDIAIGSGKLFGVHLSKNFNQPYLAVGIGDFWRRWHITLFNWFRDYIYIPLGGNRAHQYRNIFLVFLISGIWHGAAYTFILWGVLHGLCVSAEHFLRKIQFSSPLPTWFRRIITFHIVCASWVLFRSSTVSQAGGVFHSILSPWSAGWGNHALDLVHVLIILVGSVSVIIGEYAISRSKALRLDQTWLRWSMLYVSVLIIIFFGRYGDSPFIYFQF